MNNKQRKTLEAIFSNPVPTDLVWAELESLLLAIGAKKIERAGSRVKFSLDNGTELFLHKSHNPKTLLEYQIKAARQFLEKAGLKP